MSNSRSGGAGAPRLRVLVPSPIGKLGIEFAGRVVTRLWIRPRGPDAEGYIPFERLLESSREEDDFLEEALGRLSEYFAGARRRLDLDYDLAASGATGFNRRVLKETAKIPYGKTRSYQQIAQAAGSPQAYRMVLSALLANPLPILVPCHRVVTNRAGAGSYIGGPKAKGFLLELERTAAPPG